MSNITRLDDYLSGRQELYERLHSTISDGASQQEIKTIIECLRERSGTYGVQRKELINNLFKGIVELSFPHFVKYLFWGSTNNKGLFDKSEEQVVEEDSEMQIESGVK